jgi:hypothetical protein
MSELMIEMAVPAPDGGEAPEAAPHLLTMEGVAAASGQLALTEVFSAASFATPLMSGEAPILEELTEFNNHISQDPFSSPDDLEALAILQARAGQEEIELAIHDPVVSLERMGYATTPSESVGGQHIVSDIAIDGPLSQEDRFRLQGQRFDVENGLIKFRPEQPVSTKTTKKAVDWLADTLPELDTDGEPTHGFWESVIRGVDHPEDEPKEQEEKSAPIPGAEKPVVDIYLRGTRSQVDEAVIFLRQNGYVTDDPGSGNEPREKQVIDLATR